MQVEVVENAQKKDIAIKEDVFSTQFSMSQASLLRALGPQKKKVEDVDLPGAMKTGGPARKQDFGYLLVFVIQVSNRRFVSVAQIQKCAPFVYVCVRASARCLQVSLKLQSVQLALHIHGTMLFCITKSAGPPAHSCYVAWPLVPRRDINGEREYHATRQSGGEIEVASLAIL